MKQNYGANFLYFYQFIVPDIISAEFVEALSPTLLFFKRAKISVKLKIENTKYFIHVPWICSSYTQFDNYYR